MEQTFSTQTVRSTDRFAYWRDAVCDSYVMLDCDTATPGAFAGSIHLTRRERLATSVVSGSNQIVRRRLRDVNRSDGESFLVSLQMRACGVVEQHGRMALLQPGDAALYSSTDRYQLRLPDGFEQLVVQIPRDTMLMHLPDADRLTGRRLSADTPLGALIGATLPRLVNALDDLPTHAQPAGQNAIIDLLVSGFAALGPGQFELNSNDQMTLYRARAYIAVHLREPDLQRDRVAQSVGLSVRRLNEIFQKEDSSISAEIQSARLDGIRADLGDPRWRNLSVSQIAYSWGIKNFQSFSRLFKRRYGQSPSDYRAAALSMYQ